MQIESVQKKLIEEDRAAVLLGLTIEQLRQLCETCGLRPEESASGIKNRVFTYEDLYRLCCLVVRPPA